MSNRQRKSFRVIIPILLLGLAWLFIHNQRVDVDSSDRRSVEKSTPQELPVSDQGFTEIPKKSVVVPQALANIKPDLVLPALDHGPMLEKARKLQRKKSRYVFATARKTNLAPHNSGNWRTVGDKALWDFTLQSKGAESLNLGFTEFNLPSGASLTIFDPTGESQPITFTSRDNDAHGQLWTPIFLSDKLHLALVMPKQLASQLKLRLTKVNHAFRSPIREKAIGDSSSGSCNIDVVCSAQDDPNFGPLVDQYREQIRSVGAYTVGGTETCTGALINNTANDLTPYFLTAAHCEVRANNAATVVVYWNFENSVCRRPGSPASGSNGNGPITQFNSGTIFRAARDLSDFCLLELDDPVNAATNPYFAGWDRSGVNPTMSIGIHHPSVSEKRISFDLEPTNTTTYSQNATSANGTHFRIADWNFGTTEGGSSGSPLFNQQGLIVGQLHGGSAACGNNLPDWYGRLFRSWSDGGTAPTQLSNWLDPNATGVLTLEGRDALEIVSITGGSVLETDDGTTTTVDATVSISQPANSPITVRVQTDDDVAEIADNDYVPFDQLVIINAGETSATVTITINGDLQPEEHENFNLILSDATNAIASTEPGVITILNNDYIDPIINSDLTPTAYASSVFEYQITALNTPTTYSIANAPVGMTIDSMTGIITWTPPVIGVFTVDVTATNPAGSDTDTVTINTLANRLLDAVDIVNVVSLTNANPGWSRQTGVTQDGEDAAQSDDIGNGQTSSFSVDLTGPDQLTYWVRISTERYYDFFRVHRDGELQEELSGNLAWQERTVFIPAGVHTVAFSYSKDDSISVGDDAAYLDNFSLASETGRPAIISERDIHLDTGEQLNYVINSIVDTATLGATNLPSELSFNGVNTVTGSFSTPGTYSFIARSYDGPRLDTLVVNITVSNPVGPSVETTDREWLYEDEGRWFGQAVESYDGQDAAQSGVISDNESTTISTIVTGPDRMTFWWKCSSEPVFDGLGLLIDSVPVPGINRITGEKDWARVSVVIPAGQHVVSWTYSKDQADAFGADAGWVDDIRLESGGRPMIWGATNHQVVNLSRTAIPLEFINTTSYSFEGLNSWLSYDEPNNQLVGVSPDADDFTTIAVASNATETLRLPIGISALNGLIGVSTGMDLPSLIVSRASDTLWRETPLAGAVGGTAARPGDITHDESSSMTLHLQGPGTVTFSWRVSSERGADFLQYVHNGALPFQISGATPWVDHTIALAPGKNEITWTYIKDGSESVGDDLGWVDNVRLGGYARFLNENVVDQIGAEPTADPDNDGNSIFYEYAFNGSNDGPESRDVLTLSPQAGNPGAYQLTFSGLNNPDDIEYILESSPDLKSNNWTTVNIVPQINPTGLGETADYVYSGITLPTPPNKIFYRVRAQFKEVAVTQ